MTCKLLFHSLPTSNSFLKGTILAIPLNVGFKMALKVNRRQKAQQEHEGSVEIAIQCNNTVLPYRLHYKSVLKEMSKTDHHLFQHHSSGMSLMSQIQAIHTKA